MIDNGSYPLEVTDDYTEVCNTGSNGVGEGIVNPGCIDLRPLVPTYLASIPTDPESSTSETGYFVWINPINNTISVMNPNAELIDQIGVNIKQITEGLIAHWNVRDITSYSPGSLTWVDLINNNDLSLQNGVSSIESPYPSFDLDGIDDYLSGDNSLDGFSELSILAWVRLDSLSVPYSTSFRTILSKGSHPNQDYGLYVLSNNRELVWIINGQNIRIESPVNTFNFDQQAVVGATIGQNSSYIYLDGQEVASGSGQSVRTSSDILTVGYDNDSDRYWDGHIAEIMIFDRQLSQAEVQQILQIKRRDYAP